MCTCPTSHYIREFVYVNNEIGFSLYVPYFSSLYKRICLYVNNEFTFSVYVSYFSLYKRICLYVNNEFTFSVYVSYFSLYKRICLYVNNEFTFSVYVFSLFAGQGLCFVFVNEAHLRGGPGGVGVARQRGRHDGVLAPEDVEEAVAVVSAEDEVEHRVGDGAQRHKQLLHDVRRAPCCSRVVSARYFLENRQRNP